MFGLLGKPDIKKEIERRKNKRMELLTAFKNKKVLTTHDLRKYGTGVSSRIFELRELGHKISAVYERPGLYKYVYRGKSRS